MKHLNEFAQIHLENYLVTGVYIVLSKALSTALIISTIIHFSILEMLRKCLLKSIKTDMIITAAWEVTMFM